MREIIFRAKMKTDNGEYKKGDWVFGDLVRLKDGEKTLTMIYGFGEVDPETIGQYTGLTDKNGTKIFEGDIVKDGQAQMLGKVVYATAVDDFDGIAGFMVDDIDDGLQNYNGFWHLVEIIGNIHDKPNC